MYYITVEYRNGTVETIKAEKVITDMRKVTIVGMDGVNAVVDKPQILNVRRVG